MENKSLTDEQTSYLLVQKIEENSYEINQSTFPIFQSFQNKRITIMTVYGPNKLELLNIISGQNSFKNMLLSENNSNNTSITSNNNNDNKDSKGNSTNTTTNLYFSYKELKNNTVFIVLYNTNDDDECLKKLTNLLCSAIIFNLGGREIEEKDIINDINYLEKCILDENTGNKDEAIPLDFELEEIFPYLTFLTHEEEVPIFKSEFLTSQFINKQFTPYTSNLRELPATLHNKKYRNYFFTGNNIFALIISKNKYLYALKIFLIDYYNILLLPYIKLY